MRILKVLKILMNQGHHSLIINQLTDFQLIRYYQIRIENKVGKKLHQLRTECVTGVTRFLITLFGFINWPNRNINGEIELANL